MRLRAYACTAVAAAVLLIPTTVSANRVPKKERFSHVFVIYMENQSFDDVIGHDGPTGNPDTPYLTQLAEHYGVATLYFGVTHPSLPNYLSLAAGSYLGVQDDNQSCYALGGRQPGCHGFTGVNLIDSLENENISWNEFEQSMPSPGYLGVDYPATNPLYYQKHNPLVYFSDIVNDPNRLAKILPLPQGFDLSPLAQALANPKTAPRFTFIVPDECHDMHGASQCSGDQLISTGDAYVGKLFETITSSPSWDTNSVLFITWDEDDDSSTLGCCDSPAIGGGHIPTIVITKQPNFRDDDAVLYNHYSLLSTIEQGFGLPLLRYTKDTKHVVPLFDLIP